MIIKGKKYVLLTGVSTSYQLVEENEQIEFSENFFNHEIFDTQQDLENRLIELNIDFNQNEL